MNAPANLDRYALNIAEAELWCGHTPSPFDYQAMLVFPNGKTRMYQFSARKYDETGAIKQGQFWAKWDKAIAFLVRDTKGRVFHRGPVTDALGNAIDTRWQDVLAGAA